MDERCKRRQQKLDGLRLWHFSNIISVLPLFLQLSLFLFGIALAANIWAQQHTVAGVIMGIMALGFVFYTFTVVSSLRSPDCPFQTPVSTFLKSFSQGMAQKNKQGLRLRKGPMDLDDRMSSATTAAVLPGWQQNLSTRTWRRTYRSGQELVSTVLSRISGLLTHILRTGWMTPQHPDVAIGPDKSMFSGTMDLKRLDSPPELISARSIDWILETSTDTDMIIAALKMVLEVEWPDQHHVTGILDRLKTHLNVCFDSTRQLLPLAHARAIACLKAIYHICFQRGLSVPFSIQYNGIYSFEVQLLYKMPRDQDFLLISCATDELNELDIKTLPASDRIWLAHVFAYRLYGSVTRTQLDTSVIDFISICLPDVEASPRLVADCLLSVGLLIGQHVDRRYLARIDKR